MCVFQTQPSQEEHLWIPLAFFCYGTEHSKYRNRRLSLHVHLFLSSALKFYPHKLLFNLTIINLGQIRITARSHGKFLKHPHTLNPFTSPFRPSPPPLPHPLPQMLSCEWLCLSALVKLAKSPEDAALSYLEFSSSICPMITNQNIVRSG